MIKKILFFFAILICSISFSQEKSIDNLLSSPNPFSNATEISFNSSGKQNVLVTIKNILGKTIFVKQVDAIVGKNSVRFNRNNNIRSGMYIYAIQTNTDYMSKRFIIR